MITRDTVVVGRAVPDLTLEQFTQILKAGASPALVEAEAMYQAIIGEGVSPAFGLSLFQHESLFGRLGICHDYETKSPGNTRTSSIGVKTYITDPVKGRYVKYDTWGQGARDMAHRLTDPTYYYAKTGSTTIARIIPLFAPVGDNNNPEIYIEKIVALMNKWISNNSGGGNVAPSYDYYQLNIIDKTGQLIYDGKTGSRGGYSIKEIVLHETAGPSDRKDATGALAAQLDNNTLNWFLRTDNQLSIHYFLGGENTGAPVYRCCPESVMAYHAIGNKGVAAGGSVENHISIGIERMGQPNDGPVGPKQTAALCKLVLDICQRNALTADQIVSHASIQSDKQDGNTIISLVKDYVRSNLGGINKVTTENSQPLTPTPEPAVIFIPETGRSLGGGFKRFWQGLDTGTLENERLLVLGLPISNEFDINFTSDPTKKRVVQIFQRGGLIFEPENAAPWDVHPMTIPQLMEAYQYALDNHLLTPGAALTPFSKVEIQMGNLAQWGEVLQNTFESYAKVGLDEGKIRTFDQLLVAMRSGQSYDDYLAAHKAS